MFSKHMLFLKHLISCTRCLTKDEFKKQRQVQATQAKVGKNTIKKRLRRRMPKSAIIKLRQVQAAQAKDDNIATVINRLLLAIFILILSNISNF